MLSQNNFNRSSHVLQTPFPVLIFKCRKRTDHRGTKKVRKHTAETNTLQINRGCTLVDGLIALRTFSKLVMSTNDVWMLSLLATCLKYRLVPVMTVKTRFLPRKKKPHFNEEQMWSKRFCFVFYFFHFALYSICNTCARWKRKKKTTRIILPTSPQASVLLAPIQIIHGDNVVSCAEQMCQRRGCAKSRWK